ncbi:hypothetical protein [uncultured Butyricimonas sp.]|uniref:hypothetical protein n=1 Tax=uncultured Butyricimonas sp. TaxID=1268785 RepID=UPI0026DC2B0A|nr:hypothetical protein [uncultured Butyricimonas sp.]
MKRETILIVNLPPHLSDYCRHELGSDNQGRIILKRGHDIGKHIYSHVSVSDLPIRANAMVNPVTFIIPVTAANRYALVARFLYVSRWGEEKIRDYIETEFNQRMRLLFESGYRKKYTQKEIIESILDAYNIKNTAISYEAIKKSDYRSKKRTRKIIFDDIKRVDD